MSEIKYQNPITTDSTLDSELRGTASDGTERRVEKVTLDNSEIPELLRNLLDEIRGLRQDLSSLLR